MTTLEIKRLDSPVSPKQSPIHKLALRDLARTCKFKIDQIYMYVLEPG